MSLVAYDASTDEESDHEDYKGTKSVLKNTTTNTSELSPQVVRNGHISDEDDEFIPKFDDNEKYLISNLSKFLPKPRKDSNTVEILDQLSKPTFDGLPTPKTVDVQVDIEQDDEFLQKKPSKELIEEPDKSVEVRKNRVKIIIPPMKNFEDFEKETNKNKHTTRHSISTGLLSMLPKAKSEQCFAKETNTLCKSNDVNTTNTMTPPIPSFIPDSVKHRRPATNTEDIERIKPDKKKLYIKNHRTPDQGNQNVESDENEDEICSNSDFFSFNADQSLPEVSATEINNLVANKAAKIVETTSNFLKASESQNTCNEKDMIIDQQGLESSRKQNYQEQKLNSEAIRAIVGGSTKRRRQQESNIHIIDINSSEVMPKKEEWMRTALASSTTYQSTGVLVDEEQAPGTRRKHQITYLAHKAKANEAELQAMWSANRQNRRATQSKYGF